MKISVKILSGFLGLIAIMAIVAFIGIYALGDVGDGFTNYRKLALQTNQSGRVQANLLTARLNVKNFIIDATPEAIKAVETRAQATLKLTDGLHDMATDPEHVKMAEEAKAQLQDYLKTFKAVTELQAQRNELVLNGLDKKGPQIERKITATMKSAMQDGDAQAAYKAGLVLRQLLLGRLYAAKYLVKNDDASFKRVQKELTELAKSQQELLDELQNQTRRQLATEAITLIGQYAKQLTQTHEVIKKRNDLIKHKLDVIGPKVANDIETLKLDIKERQDTVGPEMVATIETDSTLTLVVSILAGIAGVAVAFFIGRGISRPIVAMTTAMQSLAQGELETEVPGQNRKDEIGEMADAVQVFKDNALAVKRMEEEQEQQRLNNEKRVRDERLQLADNFEQAVMGIVQSVGDSATTMSTSAEQMRGIAE